MANESPKQEGTSEGTAQKPAPQATPTPAPTPEAPPAPAPAPSGIFARIRAFSQDIHKRVLETGHTIDTGAKKALGLPDRAPSNQSWLKTPIYMAGDILDGIILTPARRIWEIIQTTAAQARGIYRTATEPICHPIKTIAHPIKYAAHPARIATATGKLATNTINAVPRTIDEVVERTIKNPLQRLGIKTRKIGGGVLTKIGKGIGWLAKVPRKITEFFTKPIENADDWVAAQQ
jgi:hypothetical protein